MTVKTIFSGFGGQGVLMMGYLLAMGAMLEDKYVTYLPAYGAEMRGGTANCTVAVSEEEIASPVASSPEYVVAMNNPSVLKYQNFVKVNGTLFINADLVKDKPAREEINIISVPVNSIARKIGSERAINMVMLGAFLAHSKLVKFEAIEKAMEETLTGAKAKFIDTNKQGLMAGAEFIRSMSK